MKVRLDRWIEGLKYDWNITRQRFYGVPFPVWFCDDCGEPVLATEEQLPVDPLESPPPVDACAKCGGTDVHRRPRRHGHVDDVVDDAADQRELGPLPRPRRRRAVADDAARAGVRDHPDLALLLAREGAPARRHDPVGPRDDLRLGPQRERQEVLQARPRGRSRTASSTSTTPRTSSTSTAPTRCASGPRAATSATTSGTTRKTSRPGRKLVLKLWNIARLVEQYAPDFDPRARSFPSRTARPRTAGSSAASSGCSPPSSAASRPTTTPSRAKRSTTSSGPSSATTTSSSSRTGSGPRTSYTDEHRASARSTLWETLRTLLGLYAPFLPFVTEELFQYMYAAHEAAPSIHVTAWPASTRRCRIAEVPEIETVRAVLRAVRAERTRTRPRPGPPAHGARRRRRRRRRPASTLEAMQQSLAAAARARTIRFGPATIETSLPGVPHRHRPRAQADDCSNACGPQGHAHGNRSRECDGGGPVVLCSRAWTSTTAPEEAAWRAECRAWLDEQRPGRDRRRAPTVVEVGGADYLDARRTWQAHEVRRRAHQDHVGARVRRPQRHVDAAGHLQPGRGAVSTCRAKRSSSGSG